MTRRCTPAGGPSRAHAASTLSRMAIDRRTKIVATLGPASESRERLRALIEAGVDAVRFNLSHGTHEGHSQRAWLVREIAAEVGRPIALIADLQGPKLRIGELEEPVVLRTGDQITVCAEEAATDGELPIAPAVIGDVLEPRPRGADRRRARPAARRRGRGRPRDLRGGRRRARQLAQGREPPGRAGADSLAHPQGRRRPRLGRRDRRGLRRALLHPLAGRRPRPARAARRRRARTRT